MEILARSAPPRFHPLVAAVLRWLNLAARSRLLSAGAYVALGLEVVRWVRRTLLGERRKRCLQFTSPLYGAQITQARPYRYPHSPRWPWARVWERWQGFCPCCKRPIHAVTAEAWAAPTPAKGAAGKYAFVICLWGTSPAYVLGAMVLGYSLKQTGSKYRRVCLYTDDVSAAHVQLLSKLWECRPVYHVDAAMQALSTTPDYERFAKVFTKLRGLEMVDFEKVLMMDVDLLVRGSIDHLFDLDAPAASLRGRFKESPVPHGSQLDGSTFFSGQKNDPEWSWGQGTGINAGVMLWRPDQGEFRRMRAELSEQGHPSHCKGNGPEQDYLSRYWAGTPWTSLGIEYNFQIRHMFGALSPDVAHKAERAAMISTPERVKVIHFSGEMRAKPWDRVLDPQWASSWTCVERDSDFVKTFNEEFIGYRLWIKKDPRYFAREPGAQCPRSETKGMWLDGDGHLYWDGEGAPAECIDLPEATVKAALDFSDTAVKEWFGMLRSLEAEFDLNMREWLLAQQATPEDGGTTHLAPGKEAGAGDAGSSGAGPRAVKALDWQRHGGRGGWWTEVEKQEKSVWGRRPAGSQDLLAKKLTVTCSATPGCQFVLFTEGGTIAHEERGEHVQGLFAVVLGQSVRHFPFPADAKAAEGLAEEWTVTGPEAEAEAAAGSDAQVKDPELPEDAAEAGLDQLLNELAIWAEGLPQGAPVMLALVGIPPKALCTTLEALRIFGVPQTPPPAPVQALAFVGYYGTSDGSVAASHHASTEVAYASLGLTDA